MKVIISIGMDIKKITFLASLEVSFFHHMLVANYNLESSTLVNATEVLLQTIPQQKTDCFNAISLCRKERKLVCSPLNTEEGKMYLFFCAYWPF